MANNLQERTLELGGGVVHPAVSSVLYLRGGDERGGGTGDPTVVLDEVLGGGDAARLWVCHPREGDFMAFPGDRLHGVLPGEGGMCDHVVYDSPMTTPLTCGAEWNCKHSRVAVSKSDH